MKNNNYKRSQICSHCESEFSIRVLYSDSHLRFCPFCSEEFEEVIKDQEEDVLDDMILG